MVLFTGLELLKGDINAQNVNGKLLAELLDRNPNLVLNPFVKD